MPRPQGAAPRRHSAAPRVRSSAATVPEAVLWPRSCIRAADSRRWHPPCRSLRIVHPHPGISRSDGTETLEYQMENNWRKASSSSTGRLYILYSHCDRLDDIRCALVAQLWLKDYAIVVRACADYASLSLIGSYCSVVSLRLASLAWAHVDANQLIIIAPHRTSERIIAD